MPGSCGWFPLSHAEVEGWVARHRDHLPTTLEELSLLPIPFRKVIVRAVSPGVRVAMWRTHLATFLGPEHQWTATQRAVLEEAIAAMPALVGDEPEGGQARVRAIEERLRRVFTPSEGSAMFATLGPSEPPGGLPIPADAWSAPAS
jgi:hypothetical protein